MEHTLEIMGKVKYNKHINIDETANIWRMNWYEIFIYACGY
jgi:hypothetical protein